MFARKVTLKLKNANREDFTRTLEKEVIPVLRKQKGFQDELSCLSLDGKLAVGISLWDTKENAETYQRTTYPQVLKTLEKLVDGKPEVEHLEVANSTMHKIAVAA